MLKNQREILSGYASIFLGYLAASVCWFHPAAGIASGKLSSGACPTREAGQKKSVLFSLFVLSAASTCANNVP